MNCSPSQFVRRLAGGKSLLRVAAAAGGIWRRDSPLQSFVRQSAKGFASYSWLSNKMRAGPGWHRVPPRWDARAERFGHEAELSLRITFRERASRGSRFSFPASELDQRRLPLSGFLLNATGMPKSSARLRESAQVVQRERAISFGARRPASNGRRAGSKFRLFHLGMRIWRLVLVCRRRARCCAEKSAQAVQAELISGNLLTFPLIWGERNC
jgi:hypothetical protein